MTDPLILRLSKFGPLGEEDRRALEQACRNRRNVAARTELISEGDRPTCVYAVLDGWAARYTTLEDGRRQISAFLLPGDLFDLSLYLLREMDHSVGAITPLTVAEIPKAEFEALTERHGRVTRALMWHQLVLMAIEREWVTNVGLRSAYERLAHLFCEVFLRLEAVGMTDGDGCDFPPTQHDLADATGMTTVHVNRTLQQLRADGLLSLERKRLTIPDLTALKQASLFNPNYLHLGRSDEAEAERLEGGPRAPLPPPAH